MIRAFHSSIHPSIHPSTMSENKTSTITLTHSLAFDPRTHFDDWLEDAETQARHQCPQHDATGALTLVATNLVWAQLPDNITNAAQVLAGTHPPNIRARPTWDMPAAHAKQRCCCGSLPLQGRGGQAPGFLHGQQCPHHCPIGQRG